MEKLNDTIKKNKDADEIRYKRDYKLLLDIANDINELKTWAQDRRSLIEPGIIVPLREFSAKYNLTLPFGEKDHFDDFDKRLANSPEIFNHLVSKKIALNCIKFLRRFMDNLFGENVF